jgi:hypothetical protein
VTGGIRKGAKNLLKKGIDFVRSRKQKKLEKKQAEAKVKKDKGNANIFKSILDKFSSVLDFTPKSIKKFKSEGKDNYKSKFGGGEESSEDFRFRRFTNKNGDKKVHDLKVSYKGGENVSGSGDDEVTKRIIKVKKEIMELEEDYSDNRMMGKRDDDDKAAAPAIATPLINLPNRLPPPLFLPGLAVASFFTNLEANSFALPRNSTVESNRPFIPSRFDPNDFNEFNPPSNILPRNLLGSNEFTFSSILFVNLGIKF